MKKAKRIAFYGILVVFIAVFVFSSWQLIDYYAKSAQNKNTYNRLEELLQPQVPSQPTGTAPADPLTPGPAQSGESAYVTVTNPRTGESLQILKQFEALYALNPDLVGWIRIPGTDLSYPVVQSEEDNADYYLKRDFYGEHSEHGCIYVREQCDFLAPSDNCTIYGHRMLDGTMFAQLVNYQKQSFWEQNRYIQLDSLTQLRTYEVFAVFLTTASVGQGFSYHRFVDAWDEAEYNTFIKTCKDLALYDTGITPLYGDKLITLSTCEYTQQNGRLVVVARQVEKIPEE